MPLSDQARAGAMRGVVVLDECDGERLTFCRATVRYRLEALGPDGWSVVAASAWLPEVLGLDPVPGFHGRVGERFPRAGAALLPFDASEFRPGGGWR